MAFRKIALIANLASKNYSDQQEFDTYIVNTLKQEHIEVEFYKTKSLLDLESAVDSALHGGITEFITIGGDGSLHHLVNQIFHKQSDVSKLKLAVIPKGTGNDFIRNFRFSTKREIVDAILRSQYAALDVGRIYTDLKEGYFINMLGVGFSAAVVKKLHRYKWLGGISYYLALIDTFFSYTADKIEVDIDGQLKTYDCFQLSIGNGKYAGNGMKLCPNAEINDGYFEVNIIEKISLWKLLRYMHTLRDGTYLHYIPAYSTRARRVSILSSSSLCCEADGEALDMPLEIHVLSQVLSMPNTVHKPE